MSVHPSSREAALVAGLGLLLMAVLAGLANVGVMAQLDNGADAARTTSTILVGFDKFRLAIIGLFLVAILDVIVAWALWAFFDRIQHVVAVLAACCRGIYAVIFVVAITQLAIAAQLLGDQQLRGLTDRGLQEQVAAKVQQFNDIWSVGLGLFGLHLLLIGWLAFTSGLVPRFIGVLVGIAGAGYLIDSIAGLVLAPDRFMLATFTFVGEVLLMVWLLIFAVRGPTQSHDHRQDDLRAAASSGSSGLGSRS